MVEHARKIGRGLPNGGDWGSAVQIDHEDEEAFDPHVAMSDAGDAIVVWVQQVGTSYNIAANRYTSPGGWSTAQLIETDDGRATEPRIALGPSGVAYAAWIQNDGTRFNGIASRYVPGSGWETPAPFETEIGRHLRSTRRSESQRHGASHLAAARRHALERVG